MIKKIAFALLAAFVVGGIFWIMLSAEVASKADAEILEIEPVKQIPLELYYVALCESGNRQFDDEGNVIRGKLNPNDIGRWQINETYNGQQARELGYDIYTDEGNYLMAMYLYRKNGLSDWGWSKSCWEPLIKS